VQRIAIEKINKYFDICISFLKHFLFSDYTAVSKYEAYITNTKSFKQKETLATTNLVATVITSLTLMFTELIIKYFYKMNRAVQKPKIQNTIKFKTLNLAYGFGLLGSALLHLILIQFENKDTYIAQYTVSILFNTILGSFIYANEGMLNYLKRKQKTWQDGRKLNSRTNQASRESQREIGPWMRGGSGGRDIETNHSIRPVSDNVYVIDISD
jgi:hypothetical protein